MVKQKLLLVSPMLHQGGFERVCVRTARILKPWFEVTIAIFSDADIAYDITGLQVINLNVPAAEGKVNKILNVGKRILKMAALKRKIKPDITYSFGPTANLINVLTPVCGQIWTGVRSWMDMDIPKQLKLFVERSDKVICCSEVIAAEMKKRFGADNTEVLYNPYDCKMMEEMAKQPVAGMPDFSGKKLMISVGREDDVKEFWHLLKCLALMKESVPEAALCIVGEGEFRNSRQGMFCGPAEKSLCLDETGGALRGRFGHGRLPQCTGGRHGLRRRRSIFQLHERPGGDLIRPF